MLDKTTRKLVKQDPKLRTLEEGVDKATEIDDPLDHVAQGMINIDQVHQVDAVFVWIAPRDKRT